MTDKKDSDKDVVVNLFKDKSEHVMTTAAAQQLPKEHFNKLVIDQLDRIKEDTEKHQATGIITILFKCSFGNC